jgi:4-amino-4-deoxy-L-arabinose transferase-like glycosyltransferase
LLTRAHEALVVVGACAVLYFTGLGEIPFHTRGEPREGLVVREMLRTDEWLVPARPDGEPARKPPLYYWSAATALATLPEPPELALRLPSALFATAAVVGVWATARALWGASAGLPAALVLATSFEWTRAATSARVDMTLAAALTAALAGCMLALAGRGRAAPVLAAAGVALGTLAKGPVALVLTALAILAVRLVRHDVRRIHPLAVLAAATAVAAAWYGMAFLREGGAFLDVVARENLFRFVDPETGRTGHAHGTWYLLPLGLVGVLPWTPLVPLALVPLRERPRPPAVAFAAAWLVVGFVFFSLAAAKRSVYLLPLHPALALLVGAGVASATDGRLERTARLGAALYAPVAVLVAVLAAMLAFGVDPTAPLHALLRPADAGGAAALAASARAPWLVVLGAGTALAVPIVARAARSGAWRRLVVIVATLFVVWTAAFDARLRPAIAREGSLRTFLVHVREIVPPDAPLYALFPPDPGLRFYAGPALQRWPSRGAPADGYLLLWEDDWRRFRDSGGRPLSVLAVSDARQGVRGHLALVAAPQGPLTVGAESAAPRAPAGR